MPTPPHLLLLSALLTAVSTLSAQVEFKLALQPDGQTYTVSARSQADLLPPTDNLLHAAEATIVVPAGGLQMTGLQSHVGAWELGHLIQQPAENPGADYAVFQLVGTAPDGAFPAGEEVPLFSFKNALGCTGNFELMHPQGDPFSPPNMLGITIGQTFFAEGANGNAHLGNYDPGSADCTRFADCSLRLRLELLPSGKYLVSLLAADTLAAGTSLQSLRVALKVPHHFFQLHQLENQQFGQLGFAGISRNDAPPEAPAFDYLQLRLQSTEDDGLPLQPGEVLPLLTFGNGGSCSGDSVFLVKNDDPFRPPNSQGSDVGQQVLLAGSAVPQGLCIEGGGAAACLDCAFSDEIIDIHEVLAADPVACLGSQNGMVKILAAGADSLHFSIDGGLTWTASNYFDGLPAGTYQPAVRANYFGCAASTSASPVELIEATDIDLQLDLPATVCESGNLTLQIISPSPLPAGTTFNWTGPAGFTATTADAVVLAAQIFQSGDYTLTVDAPGCDLATATAATSVVPLPEVPTLLANAPICAGDTLVLTTDVGGQTFEWLGPAGQGSSTLGLPGLTTASAQTNLPPGHPAYLTGGWQVRVTDANGCRSQSVSKEILIKNRPQAFAENDGPVCLGKPASLSANPLAGANYQWRKEGEAAIFSTQPTLTLPNVTSEQTFELTVEMDGCTSENTALTTVALFPKPAAFPTFDYDPTPDCAPQDLQLEANAAGTGLTYLWSGAGGFSSQVQDPILPQATSAANGSYQLEVTNIYGCSATSPFQITGVADPLPPPVLQTTGTACPGGSILLNAPGYNDLPAVFTWQKNGNDIFGATTSELHLDAVTPADFGLYAVEIQVGDCITTSAELLVTVLPAPIPGADFVLTFPCEGSTLQFFSNITDIVDWDWSGPNGFTSNAATPLIYNTVFEDLGTYALTVTGTNGCTATADVVVDGILPEPEVPQVATNSPVCPGTDLVLTVQNPVTLGTVFYDWVNGLGQSIGTGAPVLSLSPDNPAAVPPFLVKANVNGCNSELTDPIETQVLPAPVAAAANGGDACPGDLAQLFAAPNANATFEWRRAGEAQPFAFEQNPGVTLADTTVFVLTVTSADCGIVAVDSTTVFSKKQPSLENLTGGGSHCEGSAVLLSGLNSTPLSEEVQYSWSGPNGFFFTAPSTPAGPFPVTLDVLQPQNEGTYTLTVESAEGCLSLPQSVLVDYVAMPDAPVLAVADATLCEGENLQLDATPYSGTVVSYDWFFNDGTADQLLGSTTFPTFFVNDLTATQSGFYFVKTSVDGCSPPPSNLATVTVLDLPDSPAATSSAPAASPVCEGEAVQLSVPLIAGADYAWHGPAGFSASVNNPLLADVTTAQAGDYLVEISFADCPTVLTAEAEVSILPTPAAPQLDGPALACEGADVVVNVVNPAPGTVYEFYFSASNSLVETGSVPVFILQNIIPGQSGSYHAVAGWGGCLSANSDAFELTVAEQETAAAFAGEQQLACHRDEVVFLSGNTPTVAGGQWLALDGSTVLEPQRPNSQVQDLQPGPNRFVWKWDYPVCQQASADTALVFLEKIEALPDVATLPGDGNPLEINVLENDRTENALAWDASLLRPAAKGQVNIDADGGAVYSPWPNVFGEDKFSYQLCSMTCPEVCDSAEVRLALLGGSSAADCFVPNLFTPNGDGENDFFIVPCAAQWPGSSLVVFNRQGGRVFASEAYANDWDGSYDDQPLPNGTYFYHLTLQDGEGSALRGYVVVNR